MTVDLSNLTITVKGRRAMSFTIDDEHKEALMNGWDETALILNSQGGAIEDFERQQQAVQPWLYETGNGP